MKAYGYSETDPYLSNKISLIKKRVLKMSVARVMESAGIDKMTVATKLKALMDADATIVYNGQISKDKDGNVVKIPDNRIRLAATTLVSNMMGLIPNGPTADIHKQTTNNLIVFIEDEVSARKRVESDKTGQEILAKSYRVETEAERHDPVE
jgi:hypothetical protein